MDNKASHRPAYVGVRDRRACLAELAGCRPMFVWARELGLAVRIVEGADDCAPYFKPWLMRHNVAYTGGSVAVQVPLIDILRQGDGARLLAAVKRSPPTRLPGLPWPHSTLNQLAADDSVRAREHLQDAQRWAPVATQWEEAAGYWGLLEERAKAAECLERAQVCDNASDPTGFRSRLAGSWLAFADSMENALACLSLDLADNAVSDVFRRIRLLEQADVWMSLLGAERIATICLRSAGAAAGDDVVGSLFRVAAGWAGIAGNRRQALRAAGQASHCRAVDLAEEALFWRCIGGERARAGLALCRGEAEVKSAGEQLHLARAYALCLDDIKSAGELVKQALRRIQLGEPPYMELRAVEGLVHMLGDSRRAERLLGAAIRSASETTPLLSVAEAYADVMNNPGACREVLEVAEAFADNTADQLFCAEQWVRLLGDFSTARRCLRRAGGMVRDLADIGLLAQAWLRLLGEPQGARRVVLACARRRAGRG